MPALQLDGLHLAELDPEDAAILRELARRGRGRLILPPMLSEGPREPFGTVEVEGEPRLVTRADLIARLALCFSVDQVEGDQAEQLQGVTCSPADGYARCNFKRTDRLGSCHEAGGCLTAANDQADQARERAA